MRRAVRSLVATLLLGGVAPSLSCACGTSSQATPTADAALVDSGTPKKDGGFLDLDSDSGPKPDAGDPAPEGWATFDGIPGCPLTYPVSPEAFPPPIKWVDCPASLNLPGACKRIALDFPDPAQAGPVVVPQGADVYNGGVELTFQVFHPRYFEWRGVDGTGNTRTLLKTRGNLCGPGTGHGPASGRFAIHAYSEPSRARGGLLIGEFGSTPKVVKTYTTQPSIIASNGGILERGSGLHRIDWVTNADTLLAPANTAAFSDLGGFQEVGARVYGTAGNPYNVYEYSTGTPKKIVQVGRDVGDVGAYAPSETRMFWTNMTLDADHNGYSEDALYIQDLAADGTLTGVRQKLPLPGRQSASPSARFGCNILARPYLNARTLGDSSGTGAAGGGLDVFNFTTMKHWHLPMPSTGSDQSLLFGFSEVKLVTCTEVVATVNHYDPVSPATQQNFARFDLSKLGPGEAFTLTPDPVP